MKKRGQTATEYLIILAVVIIIALIVISVFRGVPTTGSSTKERSIKAYWDSAEVGIVAYAVTTSGLTLFIRNNLDDSIEITNVKLDSTDVYTTNFKLKTGETRKITSTALSCSTQGDAYSYDLEIKYDDLQTGASFTFTGEGNKLEGTCGV